MWTFMPAILKAIPEDFKVEEIVSARWDNAGPYSVYLLEKRGWNTVDALREISKKLNIPSRFFSYGGKKDRHAFTRQFITVEGKRINDFKSEQLSFTFQGYAQRPMGPDLIDGNRFEITVRQLTEENLTGIKKRLDGVQAQGFVNYFDDQRFGSFDKEQGFLAEKILLGHFNGAAKIYLTSIYSSDPKAEKDRKRYFLEHWKDWDACFKEAHSDFERFAFAEFKKGEKAFLNVLNQIPREEMSMFFSAYQSYLWNDLAARVLKILVPDDLLCVSGVAGEYCFYSNIADDILKNVRSLSIPTAAHNTKFLDERCEQQYAALLELRGVKIPMFNKLKVRTAFFKTTDRALVVFPERLASEDAPDELYPHKRKLILKFTLPRGSYATMLIKNLLVDAS